MMNNINDTYHAIAFFDLDGTLLNQHSQLDKAVIQALHDIRQKGILPIIATGRGHFELDQLMTDAGITSAVAMNGQYIIVEGDTIYQETMTVEAMTKLKQLADAKQQALAYYDASGYWVSEHSELVKAAYAHTGAPLPEIAPNRYLTHDIHMLLVFSDEDADVAYYQSQVPEFSYFNNSPASIDIVNAGSNKGTGVKKVVDLLGFTGETYAFGDGPNDIDLFKAVDHPTAMGNAIAELKTLAEHITSANTDNGIINAFKHWQWLPKD